MNKKKSFFHINNSHNFAISNLRYEKLKQSTYIILLVWCNLTQKKMHQHQQKKQPCKNEASNNKQD